VGEVVLGLTKLEALFIGVPGILEGVNDHSLLKLVLDVPSKGVSWSFCLKTERCIWSRFYLFLRGLGRSPWADSRISPTPSVRNYGFRVEIMHVSEKLGALCISNDVLNFPPERWKTFNLSASGWIPTKDT